MFLDYKSQKPSPPPLLARISGSWSPRTFGGPRLRTTEEVLAEEMWLRELWVPHQFLCCFNIMMEILEHFARAVQVGCFVAPSGLIQWQIWKGAAWLIEVVSQLGTGENFTLKRVYMRRKNLLKHVFFSHVVTLWLFSLEFVIIWTFNSTNYKYYKSCKFISVKGNSNSQRALWILGSSCHREQVVVWWKIMKLHLAQN